MLNGGNNTVINDLMTYPTCKFRLPDGSFSYTHCTFRKGVISGSFVASVEGVHELNISLPAYRLSRSMKLLVDRTVRNRIHLEVGKVFPKSYYRLLLTRIPIFLEITPRQLLRFLFLMEVNLFNTPFRRLLFQVERL